MKLKQLIILTFAACGVLALAAATWADPPAPTTRPAPAVAPKPAVLPKVPAAGAKPADVEDLRARARRFGLLIQRSPEVIRRNRLLWSQMNAAQKNEIRRMFTNIPEKDLVKKLKQLHQLQEEFSRLDPETQKRYRRYARQVHELVQSLPAHRKALLNAMKPEARKKELIKIIQEMRLKGQWPPKAAKEAETDK